MMRDSVAGEDPWNSSCSLTWPPATQSSISASCTDQLNKLLRYQLLIYSKCATCQGSLMAMVLPPHVRLLTQGLCAVITQAAESVGVAARYLLPR